MSRGSSTAQMNVLTQSALHEAKGYLPPTSPGVLRSSQSPDTEYILQWLRKRDMSDTRKAKFFKNGASQAVRLPADFRFDGDEVYIRRDEKTGEVVLSSRPAPHAWGEFFELMETIDVPPEFMAERPMNQPPHDRHVSGE